MRRLSIAEIMPETGLSRATVDRVLNGRAAAITAPVGRYRRSSSACWPRYPPPNLRKCKDKDKRQSCIASRINAMPRPFAWRTVSPSAKAVQRFEQSDSSAFLAA